VATNIEEALSGGSLSVSAKPVTMEALPEATIDVGGGSQSLAIEGLGVKRKKDDLSVTTSSTSQIAIQDLFGDLLDEVNFSDPSSVDAFRSSAQTRIDEMDLNSINRVLGTASSVASDISTLTSPFLDRDSSQNQFQQVFGPPAPTSVTDSGDSGDVSTGSASGFDTEGIGSSRDFGDLSALGDPSFAASAFGGAFGALGPGGSLGSFAAGQIGSNETLSSAAQAFGGFQGLQNADINNPAGALAAVTSGLNAAKGVSGLLSQAKSIPDIFSNVEKTISNFAQNAYNTITNPELAMEAYGRSMAYGTQFPDLYSFETNQGLATFAFDAKTGQIATPGLLAMMMPGPLKAAFNLSQLAMKELGYAGRMQARNASAIEAYTAPAFETPNTAVSVYSSPNATVSFDATTGDTSISGAFASMDLGQEGFGQVGFDLGALSEAMGPDGTVGSISFEGFQDSAITGMLGHGPPGFDAFNEEEAIAEDIAGQLSAAGLGTKADIADYAERSASLSSLFGEAFGLQMGMDFSSKGIESLANDPLSGMDKQLSNAPPAASGLDFGIAKAAKEDPAMAALYSMYTSAYVDMVKAEPLSEMANELGMAGSIHSMAKEAEGKQTLAMIRSNIQAQLAARGREYGRTLGGNMGEGYNSQSPSFDAVSMAEYAMEITGRNTFDTVNDVTDQAITDHVSGIMNTFGFASIHATTEAIKNETLGGMDAGLSSAAGRDPGGEEEAGYDIGFSAAAQNASAAMAALGASFGQRSDPTSDLGEMPGYHSPEFDPFGGDSQVSGGFGAPGAPGAPDPGAEGLGYGYGYGEADGGDGSDGGDWVICTELKNQGKLDAELYSVASVYFRNNLSQDTLEGYWAWAISYAERMKHNKLATSLARPLAHGRAVEIAHRIDPSKYPKSSFLGKLTIWLGEPICSLIGKSIRLFKNKQLVNKRLDY
jgi:hypothetical protein